MKENKYRSSKVIAKKASTTIRLSHALLAKLKKAADKDGRSFNNYVERILQQA